MPLEITCKDNQGITVLTLVGRLTFGHDVLVFRMVFDGLLDGLVESHRSGESLSLQRDGCEKGTPQEPHVSYDGIPAVVWKSESARGAGLRPAMPRCIGAFFGSGRTEKNAPMNRGMAGRRPAPREKNIIESYCFRALRWHRIHFSPGL